MDKIKIKLNGNEVLAEPGTTVFEVAKAQGVNIPTLCQHPALCNIGACRMCLVEIENAPALQPACTFPVQEGMSVLTETPRTKYMRKFVLEMLFSERNHYCMYCEMSGDCELQSLAYDNGLTHWTYPAPNPKMEVDASRQYFMLDHNRCIVCRRCVRACNDVVANHTIGVQMRGAKTMIIADMGVPFSQSSCTSCGTCLQVCPTGALVDRKSAYMGRNSQVDKAKSTCTFCGLGCGINVVTRDRTMLRVEGDWESHNSGVLCVEGRFKPLYDARKRVREPLVRRNENLEPTTWEGALSTIAAAMKKAGPAKVSAWISGHLMDEPFNESVRLFRELLGGGISLLNAPPSTGTTAMAGSLKDVDDATAVLVCGSDPLNEQPVLGFRIRRAVANGVPLFLLTDDPKHQMTRYAKKVFRMKDWKEAVAAVKGEEKLVVAYGHQTYFDLEAAIGAPNGKVKYMAVSPITNLAAARKLKIHKDQVVTEPAVSFLFATESVPGNEDMARMRMAPFMVYQGCYMDQVAQSADVVLPAPLWFERSGEFEACDGTRRKVNAALSAREDIWPEEKVLAQLAELLGSPKTEKKPANTAGRKGK